MRIGVVVNPIAGMGGRVGLKGTDGTVEEARARGAEPRAPDRAGAMFSVLHERLPAATVLTYGGEMGAEEARAAGYDPIVVGEPSGAETTAADTIAAVEGFVEAGVDLILFVGGDGTAADVATALAEVEPTTPVLGVPAGVKVFSSVFAVSPAAAGRIAAIFDATEDREVMDLDEAAYREGAVVAEPKAVVSVPVAEEVQSAKQIAGGTVEGLAAGFAEDVEAGVTYVLGPGGTMGAIKRALGFEGTPLGVDIWRDGEVIATDADEATILESLTDDNVVVVSPIGGQGFVLGRGNDQLSPAVLERSRLAIVASRRKLDELGVLRADTGDPAIDASLQGWHRVRVGRFEHRLLQLV